MAATATAPSTTTDTIHNLFAQNERCLWDYAEETTADAAAALSSIGSRLRRCRATDRTTFLKWAVKIVGKQPTFRPSFDCIQRLDLDVLKAFRDGERAYGNSQLFDTHVTPATTFVKLRFQDDDYLLKLPNDQTVLFNGIEYTWPEAVEKMWPCRLKKVGKTLQVVTRINGVDYHIARLLMGVRDDEILGHHNTDPLDYTGENYFVIGAGTSPRFAREQSRFTDNVMKYGTNWNMDMVYNRQTESVPAKPTTAAPRDAGSVNDGDDSLDLRSGDFKTRKGKVVKVTDREEKIVDLKDDKYVAKTGYKVEALAETSKDLDARLTNGKSPRSNPEVCGSYVQNVAWSRTPLAAVTAGCIRSIAVTNV